MASNEHFIRDSIRLGLGAQRNIRMFNNPCGLGYIGKTHKTVDRVIIDSPRLISFGLAPGASDLIGFQSVEITEEMIGQRLARFVSIEVKDKARLEPQQKIWLDMVRAAGGIAGVAHNVKEAFAIMEGIQREYK